MLKDLVSEYGASLVTTKWVQYESLTTLRSHGLEQCKRLQQLLDQDLFSVERVSQDLEARSLEIFWRTHDKKWSIVDCSGIALMEERHILYAFAADHHFAQAGRMPLIRQTPDGPWAKAYRHLGFG